MATPQGGGVAIRGRKVPKDNPCDAGAAGSPGASRLDTSGNEPSA
jgi:hypothetical protein